MKLFAREATTWIYNTVLSYVQNKEDAEEIIQDTLISALSGLKGFKNEASLKTWVYSIALNKSKDFLKYKSRKKRSGKIISINKADQNERAQYFEPSNFIHPGIELESKEQMDIIFTAINQLSENQKTAIILAKFDKIPQKEIADIMGLSLKALESLLNRAKSNLKEYLEGEGILVLKKKSNKDGK
ncbi:MAG: RNA polymerase sigma factor [Saprospiraceae bacterium]|nr:RNA polymerase sigma factor [Saprospiraceae bacterium]